MPKTLRKSSREFWAQKANVGPVRMNMCVWPLFWQSETRCFLWARSKLLTRTYWTENSGFLSNPYWLPALDLSGAAKNQPHVVLRLGAIGCKICSKKQNEHLLCVQGTSRGKPHLPSVWWFCPQLNVLNEKREGQWCNFWMSQLQRQEPTINHGGTGRRKRRN